MSKIVFVAASAVALAVSSAFAQGSSAGSTGSTYQLATLDPVVVSAARIEQPLSEVLPSLTVITREEIARAQAPTLIELLQGEPGIEVGRNGGPGAVSSLFLRGQNSISTAVFIDGVRLQTDQIGTIRLSNIPTHLIERIEILRGNVSALYGEAAIGGVVNIFTRRPSGTPTASASLGLGSRNTNSLALGLGGQVEGYTFSISADLYTTNGFSSRNPEQVFGGTNPDKDGFKRESLFVLAEKAISTSTSLGLRLGHLASRVEFDDAFGTTKLTEDRRGDNGNTDGTVFLRANLNPNLRTRLAMSWAEEKYKEYVDGIQLPEMQGGFISGKQRILRWDSTYQLNKDSVTFGLELGDSDFQARGVAHERDVKAAYAGYLGSLGRWDYQINLREDEVSGKSELQSRKTRQASWLAGLGYAMTDTVRLMGAASTGFRAPATGELYGFGGSPQLTPETHRSVEFGVEMKTQAGLSRVVVFESRANDAIIYQNTVNVGAFGFCESNCYQNVARVENKGVEFYHRGMIGGLMVKGSVVFQSPRNKSEVSFPGQQSSRLARRADHYGSLEISRKHESVEYGGRIIYSGDRVDGPQTLGAYTLVNTTATYEIHRNWYARLKLENLFDKRYQLAYGFNTPGRGVFVSLEYQP